MEYIVRGVVSALGAIFGMIVAANEFFRQMEREQIKNSQSNPLYFALLLLFWGKFILYIIGGAAVGMFIAYFAFTIAA
jgi:hypothetical protein